MSKKAVLVSMVLGALALSALITRAESQISGPQAETSQVAGAQAMRLLEAIRLEDILGMMRQEGIAHGPEMAADLFGGEDSAGGNAAGWSAEIGRIYDTAAMRADFEARFAQELRAEAATVEAGLAFFGSDLGRRIVGLEIGARATLMDETAKRAAEGVFAQLATADPARSAQLDRYVARNDLVESNVTGALNANLAFLRGLTASGPLAQEMPEEQMLADVWGQEATIRRDTVDWLFPFLTLAYQPLSDAELEQYIAFSETTAGKHLNAAFFAAFDAMFISIYTELGRAAALQLAGQDI